MPPAVAGAVVAFSFKAFLIKTLIGIAISVALNAISSVLFGKKQSPNAGNRLTNDAADRSQMIRTAAGPGRVIYGRDLVSGTVAAAFNTDNNGGVHIFVILAAHEITGIDEYWINDRRIPLEDIDANGVVFTSPFAGLNAANINILRIRAHLGADDQVADAVAVSEIDEWTTDHRLRGLAYIYVTIGWTVSRYPNGLPNVRALVRGKKVIDTRDASSPTTAIFTTNPALIIRDWLLANYGVRAATDELDETVIQASANTCEEAVSLSVLTDTFARLVRTSPASVSFTRLQLGTVALNKKWRFGDAVTLTTTTTLPSPLATGTTYYFIPDNRENRVQALFPVVAEIGTFQLAATYQDALDMNPITITDDGTGVHTIHRQSQLRYELNGSFNLDRTRFSVIEDMMSTVAAPLIYQSGLYKPYVAEADTATVTITASDLRGSVKVRPRIARQDLFNRVKGTFINPDKLWEADDFPELVNATYESQDGDEVLERNIDQKFIQNSIRAQRLGKIHLERSRQGITVELPCKWTVMQFGVWDTCNLTLDEFGWSAKKFRVIEWAMGANGDGIDLTLQEEADAVYAWNLGDPTENDPAPDTNFQEPFAIAALQNLIITESLFTARDSGGVKAKVDLSWDANTDGFFLDYEASYRLADFGESPTEPGPWTVVARVSETTHTFFDFTPGLYDFRVRARNIFGFLSAANTGQQEIVGLGADPADVTGLTINGISNMAVLSWDQHPDLDVRIGGKIKFRHSPDLTGATWAGAINIGAPAPGISAQAILPLKAGTYLVKAIDSTGNQSANAATVTTDGITAIIFSGLGTVTEHPNFTGVHNQTDSINNRLKLAATGSPDGPAFSTGTYDFANVTDLGSVKTVRLTARIKAAVINELDLIDDRTALIDTWLNIDGDANDEADAQVYFRQTDDDPAGSPVAWSAFSKFVVAETKARGFEFQARLTTSDTSFNIDVENLSVDVDEVV